MYKCDFFYSQNLSTTCSPKVLSAWHIYADKNYHYERNVEDNNYYPDDTLSFIHILDGEGTIQTQNGSHIIKKNEFVILPVKEILQYYSNSNIWEYFWVDFKTESNVPRGKKAYFPTGDFERALMQELLDAGKAQLQYQNHIDAVFFHYITRIKALKVSVATAKSAPVSIQEICSYIDQKYMVNLTVNQVASFFNISTRRLHQIFKEHNELSPKAYMLKIKINKAKQLLEQTSVTVGEISNILSFSSPFHFCKAFKQLVGTSPSAYRKNINATN